MPRNRPTQPRLRPPRRPGWLAVLLLAPLALGGCATDEAASVSAEELAETPIPDAVDPDLTLTVGTPETRVAFELSGLVEELPFRVEWANISGGPQCSEAFRANALDICSSAEVPAVHAHWTGLDTRLVAAAFREDPLDHPVYELGIAPGAGIDTLADLRGKRIAFSPGQAQGALVLRILDSVGLTPDDVELIELPSTGDVYPTALASGQVDAAPIGSTNIRRYVDQYGPEGGTTIHHGLRDDPEHLWVPTEAVADPAKAAAVREFVELWARAQAWVDAHPEEWIEGYYVEDQGLSRADGEYLVEQNGRTEIPASWDDAIERHQQTIDLLAAELGNEPFDAATLYDRRFEAVAAEALADDPSGASR
jgi:sulfonate transport system substrate-binding protein